MKQQRKEMIMKENEEILKLVKELNTNIPEEKQQELKDRIASLKTSMNQKLKEQDEEKKKEIEAKKKTITSNKYVSEKVKQKIINNKWFEITLKITDESLHKKSGKVLEKIKPLSTNISDCKLLSDDEVKVKLLHSDIERLKEELGKIGVFEIKEIEECKTEKPVQQFGGYYRQRGGHKPPYNAYTKH